MRYAYEQVAGLPNGIEPIPEPAGSNLNIYTQVFHVFLPTFEVFLWLFGMVGMNRYDDGPIRSK